MELKIKDLFAKNFNSLSAANLLITKGLGAIMDWKQQIKERLQANVKNLQHLTPEAKAALVESELQAAIEATEAGLPLGGAFPEDADDPDDLLEAFDTAGMARAAAKKVARGSAAAKARAQQQVQQPKINVAPVRYVRALAQWVRGLFQ